MQLLNNQPAPMSEGQRDILNLLRVEFNKRGDFNEPLCDNKRTKISFSTLTQFFDFQFEQDAVYLTCFCMPRKNLPFLAEELSVQCDEHHISTNEIVYLEPDCYEIEEAGDIQLIFKALSEAKFLASQK